MTREDIATNYVDGEGLEPLSWGRVRRVIKPMPQILEDFPELESLDGKEIELASVMQSIPEIGDMVISLYHMPFEKFRTLTPTNYRQECSQFAETLPMDHVLAAVTALGRDWKAIEKSIVESFDQGKDREAGVRSPSEAPRSLVQAYG